MNLETQQPATFRLTYSLRSMFVWMLLVAMPLAFFRLYVSRVTNTVDGSTIPLRNASGIAILYLLLGLLSLVIICLAFIWKRQYAAAFLSVLVVSVAAIFAFPMLDKALLNPAQGSKVAYRNTDAAIVAAIACKVFYERSGAWPKSWDDLRPDLEVAAMEFSALRMKEVNADPNRPTAQLSFEELQNSVEIDFDSQPTILATQQWTNFTGIVPHRPCYNLYRDQFSELIATLSTKSQESKSEPEH